MVEPIEGPFVVITGSGRCGTTLLRFMLEAHPDMAVPDEFSILAFARWAGLPVRRPLDWQRGFERLEEFGIFWRRWGLEPDVVRRGLAELRPGDLGSFERALAAVYAESHGKRRAAVKAPAYATEIPTLARIHPQARFVHVIRDGRDVTASFLGVPFGPSSTVEAALLWRDRVRAARRAGQELGPERYLEVRYEELAADPEATLRRVCAFVELPFDPDMLQPASAAHAHSQRLGHERLTERIAPASSDWSQRLTQQDLVVVDVLAGDLLADVGYAPSGTEITLRERLAARAGAMRSRFTSRLRRLTRSMRRRLQRARSRLLGWSHR